MVHSLYILAERWARIFGLSGSNTDTSVTGGAGPLRCDDPTGSQITRQVELPYGLRRLAQALGPARAPVSHRGQDSMRRALRSRLPTLGSNTILITSPAADTATRPEIAGILESDFVPTAVPTYWAVRLMGRPLGTSDRPDTLK
jgi:hypothetical protein